MNENSPSPKKVHPENEDLENLSRADLITRIKEQEQYIKQLESKKARFDKGDEDSDTGDKLKQQQKEAARRENTLVHRLTTKEQELQDFMNQIAEIKQAQTQGTAQLKSMLLDPAVNLVFQKMSKEMDEAQEKLKQTQNELSAWKFTPDSQTGKRLMARCQMLLQENEELGKIISSGRTAKLEGEIALQKTLVTEMKNNQSELDEFLGDLEDDVEGMQTMIYVLQQQLREAKEHISTLEEENSRLRAGDTSVPAKTFPKKPDKTDDNPVIKSENINEHAYTDIPMEEHTPVERKFYQEKTESDLEVEYNYEGLYENEDKYQEDQQEHQHAGGNGNYEYDENGYRNYAEEYEAQDYKSDDMEHDGSHEPMETDTQPDGSAEKTHNPANNGTSNRSSPTPNTVLTEVTNSNASQDQSETTSPQSSSTNRAFRQHVTDSTPASKNSPQTNSSVPETNATSDSLTQKLENQTTDYSNRQSSDVNRKNENASRIPSPKPTKVSPVKVAATKQKTSSDDIGHPKHTDKSNGSPESSTSPHRTSSSPNQLTGNEEKTVDGSRPSSQTANDRSPGSTSGLHKEREPVLQKFLNGVTSTVDDIEDL